MDATHTFDQPDQQANHLPDADAAALAELLGEDDSADPLAGIRQGDEIVIRGRIYWAIAKAPRRLALMGSCCECDFPFVESGSPRPLLKRMPKACPRHRPRPKRKKRVRRVWLSSEIGHGITQQRAARGKFSPGDFIVRGGHGYAVLGSRRAWSDRAGKYYEAVDLVGLCAECGEPFCTVQTPARLDNTHQIRRCPKHRSGGRAPKPKAWTMAKYRDAMGMSR